MHLDMPVGEPILFGRNIKMKSILTIALITLTQQCMFGATDPIQFHKKSLKKEIDARSEIVAFYKDLIENNAKVKKQFDQLLRKSQEYGDPHFGPDEPQVVEWIPQAQTGGVEEGYTTDAHYRLQHVTRSSEPDETPKPPQDLNHAASAG